MNVWSSSQTFMSIDYRGTLGYTTKSAVWPTFPRQTQTSTSSPHTVPELDQSRPFCQDSALGTNDFAGLSNRSLGEGAVPALCVTPK